MLWLAMLLACDDFLAREATPPEAAIEARVIARLNRAEYDNTVRDLFGTTLRPSVDFPADDFGYGFDNIADVLSVSPLHVELYQRAAGQLLDELYGEMLVPEGRWVVEAEAGDATGGAPVEGSAWVLFGGDAVSGRFFVEHAGQYTVAARVWTEGGAPGTAALLVDGEERAVATVTVEHRIEATLDLSAGYHTVSVDFFDAEAAPGADEELIVDWLELTGPHGLAAPPPAGRDRVLSCVPGPGEEAACVEQIVRDFGRRAWRRPLSRDELDAQLGLYGAARANGATFDQGVRAALEGILMSPWFIYRVEVPTDSPHAGPYELAARLSTFLWSSTPDDRLLDLAASGAILDDDVLEAEVRRMLDDARSVALVDNLGGQWLGLRNITAATPDPTLFPEADVALLRSMDAELSDFVGAVFSGELPVSGLLTSTRARLDDRLAQHYGLSAGGLVDLTERPGLLARAGWLASTSHPTRTSPVKRGAWVLDKVLCSPPPPAPAGVPALEEAGGASVIEQLAQHRADPSCAACHDAMDPIGIGLESFDVLGRVREVYDDQQPVQVAGTLSDGRSFDTTAQLLVMLAADPRVDACVVEQTFTYAMARAPVTSDAPLIEQLEASLAESDDFPTLVVELVLSETFRAAGGGR
jgi:hypothetical protein